MPKAKGLLCILLLTIHSLALALDWQDLEHQAEHYAATIAGPMDGTTDRSKAKALMQAADVLSERVGCRGTLRMRKLALSLGYPRDYAAWAALHDSAACEKRTKEALDAAFTMLKLAATPAQKARALVSIGDHLLASRKGDIPNHEALALEAYRRALDIAPDPAIRQRLDHLKKQLKKEHRLRVVEMSSGQTPSGPEVCIQFSDELPEPRQFHYQDYVELRPKVKAVFDLEWSLNYGPHSRLCIHGLAYGQGYELVVRKGLRFNGRTLAEDYRAVVEPIDHPPEFWFNRSAYLLPAETGNQVPLYSINTKQVVLRLVRIHERNILSPLVQRHFRDDLVGATLEKFVDTAGELVWESTLDLHTKPNRPGVTLIRLSAEEISQPGLYLLAAGDAAALDDDGWDDFKVQWLVVSDIGLTSYQGRDGLLVMARSLSTGQPLAGVTLTLNAKNNHPLARLRTDGRGLARFAPGLLRGQGGRKAYELLASAPGQGLSMLFLEHPALDLSDRGVAGRKAPGALDLFSYTEQGVYRPGDRVNAVALLRDARIEAVTGLPLTAELVNPADTVVSRQVVQPRGAGGYQLSLKLSSSARTGRWQIRWLADAEVEPIGTTAFLVEAIKPPRMEAKLRLSDGRGELQADYLFGAPAADRPVDWRLTLEPDPTPFADYAAYHFLPDKTDQAGRTLPMARTTTDEKGRAQVELPLDRIPPAGYPLRARVRAEVHDVDGSVAAATATLSLHNLPLYVGIAPRFGDDQVAANAAAAFDVVALDETGRSTTAPTLRWRLVRIERDYQWFQKDDDWGYEAVEHELPVSEGELALAGRLPARLETQVTEGAYRLEVSDPNTGVTSSLDFVAGDYRLSRADAPDAVKLKLDKKAYRPGEPVQLSIEAPFDGSATLVIANQRVHALQNLVLIKGRAEVSLPADGDWGAGAYALVTAYRPGGQDAGRIRRAVGVVWIALDPTDRRLAIEIAAPEETRSRHELQVPLKLDGVLPGEEAFVTLAAVDDGILQLTGFTPPDPVAWFHGQRRLGVRLMDIYGQIIHPPARPDRLRNGAGTSGRRGMPLSNIKLLSRFSGILQADEQGRVVVPLELPDFNGRLRLMAVAWSNHKLGSAATQLLVRDPFTLSPSLPRFLAVNDRSQVSLLLHNLEAPPGVYRVSLQGDQVVTATAPDSAQVTLAPGESRALSLPITALRPGTARLTLDVTGPAGYHDRRHFTLGVRGVALPVVERSHATLPPGGRLTLDQRLIDNLYPDGARVDLQLSATPGLDVKGLLGELERYPYGCLEQLTSRALPLLHYNQLAQRWGLPQDPTLADRITLAIERILEKQQPEGGFGLWSDADLTADWATFYALEFLIRARKQGFAVPDFKLELGLQWVRGNIFINPSTREHLIDMAYSHYLLALADQADIEQLRYFADNFLEALPTDMARAQIGMALHLYGEHEKAREAFQRLLTGPGRTADTWHDDGSPLRDLAAAISLVEETGEHYIDVAPLFTRLMDLRRQRKWLSTQEQAWLVLAARHLAPGATPRFAIDGVARPADQAHPRLSLTAERLRTPVVLENLGQARLWLTTTVSGTPKTAPTTPDNGFHIGRRLYDLAGQQVDHRPLRSGELLVAVIEGQVTSGLSHPALVVDLLPAGLEIDNPDLTPGSDLSQLHWLPDLNSPRYAERLDDRYLADLDIKRNQKSFRLAYLVRVVTPGEYTWPGVEVEDMYRPYYRGRGRARTLSVKPNP